MIAHRFIVVIVFLMLALGSCGSPQMTVSPPIRETTGFERLASDPIEQRVQVLVSEVVDEGGRPALRRHGYRLGAEYFYPASTIKLCGATAALMCLAELRRDTGLPIDHRTPMVIHPLFDQTIEEHDPTNLDGGRFTVGHEIRKIFLVSSNSAHNHLFELLGQQRVNEMMWGLGLESIRLTHRLSERRTREENLRSPRIDFMLPALAMAVYTIPARVSDLMLDNRGTPGLDIAQGYMDGDRLVDGPMSFLYKNHASLRDLQDLMIKITRPDIDLGTPPLPLTDADRALLMAPMAEHPYDSANPRYTAADIEPDDAVSYLLPGLRRIAPDADWLVHDKQGQAYGFTTENACIIHRPTGRTFFIAATIYTNPDGVLNDDAYDYAAARRFHADLAESVARRILAE